MSKLDAGLSQDVFDDLRQAVAAIPRLEAAGIPLKLWEAYCVAAADRPMFRRELRRLSAPKPPEVSSDFLEKLRILRDQAGTTIARLRKFLPPAAGPEETERQEMVLGFIAMSPAARDAATRWASEPRRHEKEAADKLRIIEGIVERYRKAVRAEPWPAETAAEAPTPTPTPPPTPTLTPAPAPEPPPAPAEPQLARPIAPTAFVATAAQGEVHLSWFACADATGYVVKRATAPGGPFVPIARPSAPSYADTGLANGTTYYYAVLAVNAAGEGPESAPAQAAPVAPPAAPANLAATAANTKVTLTWSAAPGATAYTVKRATAPAGPFAPVASTTAPTWTDTSLANGTAYTWVVSAVNAGGESPHSGAASATPVAPPSAPGNVAAAPGNASVALSWTAVPGAANYRVMRSTTPGGPYTAIASPAGTSHVDTTVSNGTTYYYVVRTVNAGGKGPHSAQVQAMPVAPPAPPTDLAASPANSQVTLSWAAAARAAAYGVKRATAAAGPFSALANPAGTSFTDTTAVNGTTYWYSVCAVNAGGEGPSTAAVEATPVAPPAPPAEVFATPGNGQITLAWAASPRARFYTIKRASAPAGPFTGAGMLASPPFTDTGLSNGTTYHYLVTATNAGGESAASPVASAAPVAPPAAPGGLSAQPGNGRVTLAWVASARAAAYGVKRATSPAGPWTAIASPAATSHLDTTVTNGTAYLYAVAATNAGGESAASAPVEAMPVAPPAVPTGLSASPGNAQVVLAWAPSNRAVTYAVRRGTSPGGPHVAIAATAVPSFIDPGLSNGTTYHYVVSAANAGGGSADSLEVHAAPVAPPDAQSGLTASPGNAQVSLAWPPAPGATGYVLRRAVNPAGPWTAIASPTGTSFVDAGLANGETYFYTLSAVNAGGESSPSPAAEAWPVAPPPAPAGLAASPGHARVALAWSAVEGAGRYRVKRAAAPAGPFAEIAAPRGPSYVDLAVTDGTTYWYAVTAVNAGGESALATPVPAAPVAPPAAPTGLAALPGNGRISLAWTAPARATSYAVKRSTTPGGPYASIAIPTAASHTDADLANGVSYFYAVSATNAGGESPDSAPVQAAPVAPPAAPSGLAAAAGNGQVSLSWKAVPEAAAYSVKRADAPGRPHVAVAGPSGPSHIDTDLENGRAYSYAVSAVNAGGESPDSAPAGATPLAAADAPAGLAVVPGNAHVTLSWRAAPGAAGYVVKRATAPGGPFGAIAQCSDPSCDDGMVTNGATYYYVVSAKNAGGESPDSLPAEARPVAPPAVPTGLACTPGNGQIQLAWTAAAGAEKYIVKRSFERRGPFLAIGTAEGSSHIDRDLQNGTAYYYIVTAVNAGGESHRSSRAGAVPVAPPPAPAGLAADAGDSAVTLTWTPSAEARRYRLKRSLDRRGPYTPLVVTAELGHVDRNVANGTTYYYIVSAFNAGGASPPSPRASASPAAPPAAPPGLAASPGNAKVSLLWTAVPGAATYRILRAEAADGDWSRIAEQSGTAYVDAKVENGRNYSYAVRAVSPGGESADSPRAQAAPQGPPPIPSDATAAPGDSHVTLLWRACPGATCYSVKRGASSTGPYVPIATPTAPSYTDTGLANGSTVYYRVRSVSPSGESPDTPPIAATPAPVSETPPPTPAPPSDTFASHKLTGRPGDGGNGEAHAAVLAPVRDREESEFAADRLPIPGVGGAPSPGIDLEKLLDLKRVDRLRSIFEVTAQKIETWEVLCVIAAEGHEARREMERLVRLKDTGDEHELNEGAAGFFDKLLKVRSEAAGLIRDARAYFESLGLRGHGREAMEIAIGLLVSAPKGRHRARLWVEHPDDHRRQATSFMEHALTIADTYVTALRSR